MIRRPPTSPLFPYPPLSRPPDPPQPLPDHHPDLALEVHLRRFGRQHDGRAVPDHRGGRLQERSEEHTSELQSRLHLVCRLLLEKKKDGRGIPTPASAS